MSRIQTCKITNTGTLFHGLIIDILELK